MKVKTEIHDISEGVPLDKTPCPCFFQVIEGESFLIGKIGYRPPVSDQPVVMLDGVCHSYRDSSGIKRVKPLSTGSSFTVTIIESM